VLALLQGKAEHMTVMFKVMLACTVGGGREWWKTVGELVPGRALSKQLACSCNGNRTGVRSSRLC